MQRKPKFTLKPVRFIANEDRTIKLSTSTGWKMDTEDVRQEIARYLSRCKKCLQGTPVIGISRRRPQRRSGAERTNISPSFQSVVCVTEWWRGIKGIYIPLGAENGKTLLPPHSLLANSPAPSAPFPPPFLLLFYELVNCPFRNAVAASNDDDDDVPRSLIDVSLPRSPSFPDWLVLC